MVLAAVILGYILGIAPFIAPKLIEYINQHEAIKEESVESKEQKEIYDEWLNGPKRDITQEDLYKEYVTGQETVKGD